MATKSFCIFFLCFYLLWGTLCIFAGACYPIAPLSDNEVVMMHQDDKAQLQLYIWDLAKRTITEPLLAPYYHAALVKVLPDGDGISFIDEESIFIQRFNRRSARRIEIDEPLYGIELVEWIDNDRCYFHAFEGNRAGIYQLSRDGDIDRLMVSTTYDYLYPQIVGDNLFYIKRAADYHYFIAMLPYQKDASTSSDQSGEKIVYDCGNHPMILLHMISATCGYCLEHPVMREHNETIMSFPVHFVQYDDSRWQRTELFSLRIPAELIFDESKKLVESLVPFVPYYHNDLFYFSSCPPDSTILAIYCYDHSSHKTQLVVHDASHLLAPIIVHDYLIYGGIDDLRLYGKPLA